MTASTKPCSQQELRASGNHAGSFLPDRLLDDAGARQSRWCAPGLGHDDVAVHGEAGGHAPGGRGRSAPSRYRSRQRRSAARTAALVLAICIRRQDALLHPGAAGDGKAHDRQACAPCAYSNRRVIFSPTTVPMAANHKVGVHNEQGAGLPANRRPCRTPRPPSPGRPAWRCAAFGRSPESPKCPGFSGLPSSSWKLSSSTR